MKLLDANDALDQAFLEGLKSVFLIFRENLSMQDLATAKREFVSAVTNLKRAHDVAGPIIKEVFEE